MLCRYFNRVKNSLARPQAKVPRSRFRVILTIVIWTVVHIHFMQELTSYPTRHTFTSERHMYFCLLCSSRHPDLHNYVFVVGLATGMALYGMLYLKLCVFIISLLTFPLNLPFPACPPNVYDSKPYIYHCARDDLLKPRRHLVTFCIIWCAIHLFYKNSRP